MKRLLWLFVLLVGAHAHAHKPSDSYVTLTEQTHTLSLQWDIALRDLDLAVGVDANHDGKISWGELKAAETSISHYAFSRLNISADGKDCPIHYRTLQVDHHTDGAYAVLQAELDCAPASQYQIDYHLLFDLDRLHKGVVTLRQADATRTLVASADDTRLSIGFGGASRFEQLLHFITQGMWHIWQGYDHVLFLLSLLIPSVLVLGERKSGWLAAEHLSSVLKDSVGIVTAFTLAHSITLALAALNLVHVSTRLAEASIALTVIMAALNNIYPLVHHRRWLVTFGFGLIHGFGFASTLTELNLGNASLALTLLGFNVGVELGQLAVLVAFLPLAFSLRKQVAYRRVAVPVGSMVIALIAAGWFSERAFNMKWMPF